MTEGKRGVRGIGLMSGGLDSMLAVRLLTEQGIDVLGVTFRTPFFGSARGEEAGKLLGIEHLVLDITDIHLALVKDPPHGYGKNMNPCIDCHAMMFRVAGDLMDKHGAAFLFSGEVLGQRPMSQNMAALKLVETLSGRPGRILRPLSAKLLPETDVEREGLVDRARLLDIQGRSRKRQMELVEGFNINRFPSPGGGCLLTDPGFSARLKELFDQSPQASPLDVERLKVGRHFRLPGGSKVVVGRDKAENEVLEGMFRDDDYRLMVAEFPGPVSLLEGGAPQGDMDLAAAITVRYSKAVGEKEAQVTIDGPGDDRRVMVAPPAEEDVLEELRIG